MSDYETVPVFHPTLAEMKHFSKYLKHLEQKGAAKVGLCKIVPPPTWKWNCNLEEARGLIIDSPILQAVSGRAGVLTVSNIVQGAMSVREFEALAESKQPRAIDEMVAKGEWYEIERKFWKSMTTTADPPMYGADTVATLFGDADVPFNVNKLDCMLKRCGVDLPGVTKPMLYFGMYRAFFAYHTEDLNFFSINFLHHGKPKMWYAVPASHASRIEVLAKSLWPDERCSEMLRHKTKLISPSRLTQAGGIPVARAVQRKGEIMITWPESYHSGFNLGFNIAEAVNFVPPSLWRFYLDYGRTARWCQCRPDSIRINVDWLEASFKKGRPAPESSDDERHEAPPLDVARRVRSPAPGQAVLLWVDGDWVRVNIVSVEDQYVRVHETGARASDDVWVDVNGPELRSAEPQPEEIERPKMNKRARR